MQKNKKLDYDTIYNGRAVEISKMIMSYYGEDIKLVSKKEVIPDRPERDNVVGVVYTYQLYKDYTIACGIQSGVRFTIILGENNYITEAKYMTWNKIKSLSYKNGDEIVKEKLEIFNNVIQALRNGKEIEKVDVTE